MKYLIILILLIPSSIQTTDIFYKTININIESCENSVSIVTLNAWGLPFWYKQATNENRFFKLISSLNSAGSDIICLQETFNDELRKVIKNNMRKDYFSMTDLKCSRSVNHILKMDCNGGLATFSRFPVISEYFFQFPVDDNYSLIEKAGRKGFLFTTVNVNGDYINILNTHLYSGDNNKSQRCRIGQIEFIEKTLDEIKEYKQYPTIFAGDYNMQHPDIVQDKMKKGKLWEYFTMVKKFALQDSDEKITSDELTFEPNFYNSSFEPGQKLDYVFFKDEKCCMEILGNDVIFKNNNTVSDHYGYRVFFRLNGASPQLNNDYIVQK